MLFWKPITLTTPSYDGGLASTCIILLPSKNGKFTAEVNQNQNQNQTVLYGDVYNAPDYTQGNKFVSS